MGYDLLMVFLMSSRAWVGYDLLMVLLMSSRAWVGYDLLMVLLIMVESDWCGTRFVEGVFL